MFLMIFAGFTMVKLKIVKTEQSRVMSLLVLYLIMPCGIFSGFIVDYQPEVLHGLLLVTGTALLLHIWMIAASYVLKKLFHLDGVEQAAIIYSNAGNLILPVVSSILGTEYVIYSVGYMIAQNVFMWSHGKMAVCGEPTMDLKKMLTNINLVTIYVGLFMFITGIHFPAPVHDAISSLGSMIGPMAMLVTGMLLANVSVKKLLSYRRIWMVTFFRLILLPLGSILIVKYSGLTKLVPNGQTILMVTLLASMAPMASTITQFAQVYDKNADYASAINVVTTMLCIVTMPLLIAFYQM